MWSEPSLYRKRKMLWERGSEGSKSYLERLRGVRSLIGKSFGSCLIGKRGRSLGIRWRVGVEFVGFLYAIGMMLSDALSWLLTVGRLRMTERLLRICNRPY